MYHVLEFFYQTLLIRSPILFTAFGVVGQSVVIFIALFYFLKPLSESKGNDLFLTQDFAIFVESAQCLEEFSIHSEFTR